MSKSWLTAVSAVLISAMSTGCGGGGGGGGGSEASGSSSTPVVKIADSASPYWVTEQGGVWTYRLTDRRGGMLHTRIKTVEDRGETLVNGKTVRHFEHSWSLFANESETEYRYLDGGAIRTAVPDPLGSGASAVSDYAELPAPLMSGSAQTLLDVSETQDLNGDGVQDVVRLVLTATLSSEDRLTVPAGTFSTLLRSRQEAVVTVRDGASGRSVSETSVLTTWYASGVGIVKRVYEDPGYAAPDNVATEELLGVSAGGVKAGLVANRLALDGIGSGGSTVEPGRVAMAKGTDAFMTIVTTETGTVEGAIHDLAGRPIWRGTVLAPDTGRTFDGAAVAFDGTDFRVVAIQRETGVWPSDVLLKSQRASRSGDLRDPLSGALLDTGLPSMGLIVQGIQLAARAGNLLVLWRGFDWTVTAVEQGINVYRGNIVQGRLFDAAHGPQGGPLDLGSGLVSDVVDWGEGYLALVAGSNDADNNTYRTMLLGVTGLAIAAPVDVANGTSLKTAGRLAREGTSVWLTYKENASNVSTITTGAIVAAPLRADGTLALGDATSPGRRLVDSGDVRGSGMLAIGGEATFFAWSGTAWSGGVGGDLFGTRFDTALWTGGTSIPAQGSPISGSTPPYSNEPGRHVVGSLSLGPRALLLAWLDNEASTVSDRVMFAISYPPYPGL